MRQRSEDYANIEDEIVSLLNRLVSELPSDAASVQVMPTPKGDGTVGRLRPRNASSASILLHAENGLDVVDFNFGDYGTTWELPIEGNHRRASKTEVLNEIEQMCRAVMAGNCQHKRGLASITGSLWVGDTKYRITDLLVFRPNPPLRGTRKYDRYT